jgi:hypothetical protein
MVGARVYPEWKRLPETLALRPWAGLYNPVGVTEHEEGDGLVMVGYGVLLSDAQASGLAKLFD